MSGDLLRHTARELAAGIRERRWSALEVAEATFTRIAEVDGELHGYLSLRRESALREALAVDLAVSRGDLMPPLAGVPIAIKDNILDRGGSATCASRMLAHFVPTYDATVVERVRAARMVMVGKTNLDEFAMGSSTENSAFFPSRNPWDPALVPGGSSGGSAVAVASGGASLALGSDTGGSVRQPGAFCGLVALKPHYGHVSRFGLVAFASSLDQIGPFAKDALDCALLWNAIAGADPRDATCRRSAPPLSLSAIEERPSRFRLGVPRAWLREGLDPEVQQAFEATCRRFEAEGGELVDVDLLSPEHAVSAYYILANAEASSNLARFDGVRYGHRVAGARDLTALYEGSRGEGFGTEVKRRILLGTFVLSSGYYDAYYAKAQAVRARLKQSFDDVLERVDAILLPTTPTPPFAIGERLEDPLSMYLSDIFTVTANLIQNPAVSFPAGATSSGLPIGMQLYGRARDEEGLLRLVRLHEQVSGDAGSSVAEGSPVTGPVRNSGVSRRIAGGDRP